MAANHTAEAKAAVMAALLAGQSVTEVATQWDIPKQTVSRWKQEIDPGQVGTKKDRIEGLLLSYLETNLETLRIQSEFFRDRPWLEKQDASEVAVLHGVVADKSIRLLEALQAEPTEPDAGAEGGPVEAGSGSG